MTFIMKKLFVVPGLLFACVSFAQPYAMVWHKIAGGGGASTGGSYAVTGTIGQPDAGSTLTGGSYAVTGGFWSLIAVVQAAGLPNLTIAHVGNSISVSWPNSGTYTLQQNNNLAAPAGWVASSYPVTISNGTNRVTITPPAGNGFFRLSQ